MDIVVKTHIIYNIFNTTTLVNYIFLNFILVFYFNNKKKCNSFLCFLYSF